jgi:tagatose 6-phosphate kinase
MILCLGTTPAVQRTMTFERLQLDGVNRAHHVAQTASGKSINVARVARTLGAPVTASGFIGGDAAAFIRKDLDAAGVPHDFAEVEPTTRTCVTLIDQAAGTATELIEESKTVESEAWGRLTDKLDALLPSASLLVLSGTLAPGAPQDFCGRCVQQASARGVRTIVDATSEPLRHAIAANPFVVKPNRGEIAKTLGVDTSTDAGLREAMRRVVAEGAQWVVVTMGREGAIASDGSAFWRVAIPPVKVVNPIGSGDAFAAGLAVALTVGPPLPEALVLAAACGVANAMTPVAGQVRPDDVAALLGNLDVKKV